jgi:hypothetical protein
MRLGITRGPRDAVGCIRSASVCAAVVLIVGGCGASTRKPAADIHWHVPSTSAEATTISKVLRPIGFTRAPCQPSPNKTVCFTRRHSIVLTAGGFAHLIATTGLTPQRNSLWCLPQTRPATPRFRVEHCHDLAELGTETLGARAMSLVVVGPRTIVSTTRDLPVTPSGATVLEVEDFPTIIQH